MTGTEEYLSSYLSEADELLERLNQALLALEKNQDDKQTIHELFRAVHTLKSSSAFMGYDKISKLAHSIEDILGIIRSTGSNVETGVLDVLFDSFDAMEAMIGNIRAKKHDDTDIEPIMSALRDIMMRGGKAGTIKGRRAKSQNMTTLRYLKVDIARLDKLVDLVGELLISKMRLEDLEELKATTQASTVVDKLGSLIDEIQYEVMQARMVPISQVFDKFPRLVRDLSQRLGKEIDFKMDGGDIELDRTVLDRIGDPLVHLLRNAIDHGMEKGKKGEITLRARREKSVVVVEVADNGRGFDLQKIRKKAAEKGIASTEELAVMSRDKLIQMTFHPSFSTADSVTDVSGRGVGLDVVKTMIQNINGGIRIESEEGKGTTFRLELPLTLAIIRCFIVSAGQQRFAVPITNVLRYVRLKGYKTIEGREVFLYEDTPTALVHMRDLLHMPRQEIKDSVVIVLELAGEKAGLVVDSIVGEQEIIMKPLAKVVNPKGFAGATILGDGTVALILDTNSLLENGETRAVHARIKAR